MRLVSCHRMPCLADLQGYCSRIAVLHHEVIPADCNIGLAETELCSTVDLGRRTGVGESRIEVSLDLRAEFGTAELVACDIKSDSGRQGQETERSLGIEIVTETVQVLVQRGIIEEVASTCLALPCIEGEIVSDKSIEFHMGRFLHLLFALWGRLRRHRQRS